MANLGGNSRSTSLRSPEPVPVSAHSGDDRGREEKIAWALGAVNNMVELGIIENTVEKRAHHLNALLDVLLSGDDA